MPKNNKVKAFIFQLTPAFLAMGLHPTEVCVAQDGQHNAEAVFFITVLLSNIDATAKSKLCAVRRNLPASIRFEILW
jgi:hypothetical protein